MRWDDAVLEAMAATPFPRRPRAEAPIFAAVDLGTNNCRMLVARPARRGFRVIDAFSRPTRLGEGLTRSGTLSAEAMDRTIEALRLCADKMARRGVTRARHVATEACRRAANCGEFVARARREAGLELEIISAEEEARLAFAGCEPLLTPHLPHGLVFDIGGGSTELLWVRRDRRGGAVRVEATASIPYGVVTLAEQHRDELETAEGYEKVVGLLAGRLALFEKECLLGRQILARRAQMLGTSGTVTTLAGIHFALPRYDRNVVDGSLLRFCDILGVARRLAGMPPSERAKHPCIGPDRADLVVAGCAILEAICAVWPVGRLRVADRGVREGILMGLMRETPVLAAQ